MAGIPFKLTPEDMGQGDFVGNINKAFASGLENYLKAAYSPRLLENEATKGEIVNKFLPREKESSLAHEAASTQGLNIGNEWAPRLNQSQLDTSSLARQKMNMELNPALKFQKMAEMFQQMQSSPLFQEQSGGGQDYGQGQGGGLGGFNANQYLGLGDAMDLGAGQGNGSGQGGGGQGGAVPGMGGISKEQMRRYFLKEMGIDPDYQSPEQKMMQNLKEYQAKQQIKNSLTNGTKDTNAVKTKAQNVINGVNNALPLIDELIESTEKGNIPGQLAGHFFQPNRQATYEGALSEVAETLANALGYPNTEGGFLQAEKVVGRRKGETDYNYAKRLRDLRQRILTRQANAQGVLRKGTPTTEAQTQRVQNKSQSRVLKYDPETGKIS